MTATQLSRSWVVLALALGAATSTGAQTVVSKSAATPPVHLQDRFPGPIGLRLNNLVDSAEAEGLPTKPLILRALEGQAKNVPPATIVEVVARLRIDLQRARQTLGIGTNADDLTSAAAALKAGISVEKLTQLRQLRGKQPLTVPLDAWLGLISRGAPSDLAWDHIAGLAKKQARDAEFIKLTPSDLTRGIPKGGP